MTNENKNIIDHPYRYTALTSGESSERSEKKKPNYFARRLGAAAAVLITAASSYGVIKSSVDYMSPERDTRDIPTKTETVLPGDNLWEMTDDVKNIDDKRIVIDWAEKNSPDLTDGVTNIGDKVVLPVDARDIN